MFYKERKKTATKEWLQFSILVVFDFSVVRVGP